MRISVACVIGLSWFTYSIHGFSAHEKSHHHPPQHDATSGRRHAIQQLLLIGSSPAFPSVANAEYGIDAKMTFPDVMQGLSDRANKQCLVENLGTRECLVYQEDAEKFLYKGADASILIQRVQASTTALNKIPPLVETKKWNAITGILTGPLGELSRSLTMISRLASDPSAAKDKAQVVKQDLFAMGTAATNKHGGAVLQYQRKAIDDLAIFLQSL